jgi:transposase
MQPSRPYPSDLSDARWELIRPTLEAWRQARNGIRKPTHDLRALMNAILYVDRTGIPWRYLPHDFPPHQTVYGYFARWEADGIFDQLTGPLRGKVRQAEDRTSEPSACLIDSQSIKTSATVHLSSQGTDPAKKIIGRKRHLVTDTLGLLLAVTVTAASVHDSTAGTQLLADVAAHHPTITKAWADKGYKTKAVEHAAHLGIDLEIVQRDPTTRGFHVQPRRWVIERTLGWLMHHRRLARDYETHPQPIGSHDPTRRHQPHDPPPHPRNHPQLARELSQMKQTIENQTLTDTPAAVRVLSCCLPLSWYGGYD